jgi:hypothetical protein
MIFHLHKNLSLPWQFLQIDYWDLNKNVTQSRDQFVENFCLNNIESSNP